MLYLLVIAIALCFNYFIADWFYEVAQAKGFGSKKYFWICFWLGLIGWLLVIALPDRGRAQQQQLSSEELPEL